MKPRRRAGWWQKATGVMKTEFKVALVYKLHFFVSLFSVPINVLIYYFLWQAIFTYSGEDVIRGYTFGEMVTYYVISMIVGFMTYSEVDEWMEYDVVHGHMVNALMKPFSYFSWNLYATIAINGFGILVEIIPVFIVGLLIGLQAPALTHLALFLVSVVIAAALYHLFAYLTGLAAFWLKRIRGLRRSRRIIIAFLSGSLLPLTFFPVGLQGVFEYLPFTFMRFTPVQLYMGKMGVGEAVLSLSVGVAWVLLLYLASRQLWERAFKKFSGAGT